MDELNPCLNCGACCAHYRVSFYWAEGDDATKGGVPVSLTVSSGPWRRAMLGTNGSHPHCIALQGAVGEKVCCTIYDRRPSVCRNLAPSWVEVDTDSLCDKARGAYGLPLLRPLPVASRNAPAYPHIIRDHG